MEEKKEKKWDSRRLIIGGSAIGLISVAFYVIIFTFKHDAALLKIGQDLFGNYTAITLGIVGFILGALSATDILGKKK